MNKDMSQYRKNRADSEVVKNWINDYKQSIMSSVLFRDYNSDTFNKEWLEIVRNNPECAEVVADTIIGWLNSPVGRSFISKSFNVKIPIGNDGIDRE